MGGGWQTYQCDRCPLVIELGGSTFWDDGGNVYADTLQFACADCGTLHRVIDERGVCRVTALPGPVRTGRTETGRNVWGDEFTVLTWFTEADWRPVGPHAGGLDTLAGVRCSYCGAAGRMLTHERFLFPHGHGRGEPRREDCPVCRGPMQCVAVTDAI